ncbi:hypothetical protein [Saccharothrix sp.]|uniref:hypothetical protein n=1 Tax=Saccharothrix sp. TaxID=1873460 RepID=UPI00281215D3|nr:hypothetical protein [Saccharothrix sp.]
MDSVGGDFYRYLLPVVLAHESAESLAVAVLSDEIAPGISNRLSLMDRARDAYRWAARLGLGELRQRAAGLLRRLAQTPGELEDVRFMWKALGIPESAP